MAETKADRAKARPAVDREEHRRDLAALERRLEEAEDSLNAIRTGEVDALVIKGPLGDKVYTLKDADRPYRTIIENMREGTVTFRPDGLVLYANKQLAAMLGVPLEELLGASLFDWIEPSGLPGFRRLMKSAEAEGARGEVELRGKAGRRLQTLMSIAPMNIESIRVLSGVVADVTEERRAHAERERLAAAISQAIDGVVILDAAGRISYVNPACREITGYGESELIGAGLERFEPETVAVVRAALEKEEAWKGHIVRTRKNESLVELDVSVAPLRSADGAISNYIIIFRDVTHAAKLEKKVRQMERTEALGRLAGGVAHDLNNILQPIILNAELLLSETEPETRPSVMLENLLRAAYRQKDLVTRILSFTRQTKHVHKAMPLKPLVEEALKLLKPSLPASIELRFTPDVRLDTISGDSGELHELVTNLYTNAVDSMEGSGGVLEVGLADAAFAENDPLLEVRAGRYVQLTVKDTGCGISPQDLGRIFDPFFTTKATGKGTGIGLSVVRGIVKSHGGAISVDSRWGRGTEVRVFLPAVEEEARSLDPIPIENAPTFPGRRILIVDDEDIILETMRQALTAFGIDPTMAKDADQALAVFRGAPEAFDLAIVDQTMPGMSGLELAAEMRRLRPGFPILLATGYNRAVDGKSLRQAGVSEVLMKPMSLTELAGALARILAGAGRAD